MLGSIKAKFWNVGYTWFLPVAFTPSRQPVSPLHPLFWHRMPVFMGCLETLPPLVAFNETRESFFRGVRHVVVVVRFPANVFRREKNRREKKKKKKEKGKRRTKKRLFEFFKTHYTRSFRLVVFLNIISLDDRVISATNLTYTRRVCVYNY